jgi:hypothetical protein
MRITAPASERDLAAREAEKAAADEQAAAEEVSIHGVE